MWGIRKCAQILTPPKSRSYTSSVANILLGLNHSPTRCSSKSATNKVLSYLILKSYPSSDPLSLANSLVNTTTSSQLQFFPVISPLPPFRSPSSRLSPAGALRLAIRAVGEKRLRRSPLPPCTLNPLSLHFTIRTDDSQPSFPHVQSQIPSTLSRLLI